MKLITEWWGCQLIAENDRDVNLLNELKISLPPDSIVGAYEHAELEIFKELKSDWFKPGDLKERLVLEIRR